MRVAPLPPRYANVPSERAGLHAAATGKEGWGGRGEGAHRCHGRERLREKIHEDVLVIGMWVPLK